MEKKHGRTFWDHIGENPKTTFFGFIILIILLLGLVTSIVAFKFGNGSLDIYIHLVDSAKSNRNYFDPGSGFNSDISVLRQVRKELGQYSLVEIKNPHQGDSGNE